jgi:hypothetical protein
MALNSYYKRVKIVLILAVCQVKVKSSKDDLEKYQEIIVKFDF